MYNSNMRTKEWGCKDAKNRKFTRCERRSSIIIKKTRRGWYVAPGGKMDPGESIYEAAVREFTEETGAEPVNPHLKGVYTMVITDDAEKI